MTMSKNLTERNKYILGTSQEAINQTIINFISSWFTELCVIR